jgi:predicted  nucleic acid-binding Zn-ribbon protein
METILRQKVLYQQELDKAVSEETRLKNALEKIQNQKFRLEGAILAADELINKFNEKTEKEKQPSKNGKLKKVIQK